MVRWRVVRLRMGMRVVKMRGVAMRVRRNYVWPRSGCIMPRRIWAIRVITRWEGTIVVRIVEMGRICTIHWRGMCWRLSIVTSCGLLWGSRSCGCGLNCRWEGNR
jgi:hypothetical protein